jgi:hypothetical protein
MSGSAASTQVHYEPISTSISEWRLMVAGSKSRAGTDTHFLFYEGVEAK